MNREMIYFIYVSAILLLLFVVDNLDRITHGNQLIKGTLVSVGIGIFTFFLIKSLSSQTKILYKSVATKFNGKVSKKTIFSPLEVSFDYNDYPVIISYFQGNQYTPSSTFVKIRTDIPSDIRVAIDKEGSLTKSLKRVGPENSGLEMNEEFFKKFKFQSIENGQNNLNRILTPKIMKGFLYFYKKSPSLTIADGEVEFRISDLPLHPEILEEYYSFAFHIVDHMANCASEPGLLVSETFPRSIV